MTRQQCLSSCIVICRSELWGWNSIGVLRIVCKIKRIITSSPTHVHTHGIINKNTTKCNTYSLKDMACISLRCCQPGVTVYKSYIIVLFERFQERRWSSIQYNFFFTPEWNLIKCIYETSRQVCLRAMELGWR